MSGGYRNKQGRSGDQKKRSFGNLFPSSSRMWDSEVNYYQVLDRQSSLFHLLNRRTTKKKQFPSVAIRLSLSLLVPFVSLAPTAPVIRRCVYTNGHIPQNSTTRLHGIPFQLDFSAVAESSMGSAPGTRGKEEARLF